MHENTVITALPPIYIHSGDAYPIGIIFEDDIPLEDFVETVELITIDPAGELVINNAQPNESVFNDKPNNKGKLVPIGKAVLGTPSGQVNGHDYTVEVYVTIGDGEHSYPKVGVCEVRCRNK